MGEAKVTRKEFLCAALGASAVVLSSCSAGSALASVAASSSGENGAAQSAGSRNVAQSAQNQNTQKQNAQDNSKTQYGFWVDTSRCIGCATCVASCIQHNETPENLEPRRRVLRFTLDDDEECTLSYSCMHCAEPACMNACPAHAITKREDGIVVVDQTRCIGCQYCRQACPFDIPRYAENGMDKCDCCLAAGIKPGSEPYCVRSCPTKALHYGTMNQLKRESRHTAEQLDAPTQPSFYLS